MRRLALTEANCADPSFIFTLDAGRHESPHLRRDALALFETRHRTPYHFAFHTHDVGRTLLLGATGSGKRFLLNFLFTHAQKYSPMTVIFDLGHNYRKLATLFSGSYVELGLQQRGVTINPFALSRRPKPALPACVRPRPSRRRGRVPLRCYGDQLSELARDVCHWILCSSEA